MDDDEFLRDANRRQRFPWALAGVLLGLVGAIALTIVLLVD